MYPQSTVELARALSSLGALDRENAAICGVSVAAIRHWRRGSYLLGLYLGDGHLTLGHRSVYALSITCCDGWPGRQDQARAAMAGVMPSSRVFAVARTGCTEIKSTSKHWLCLFPQHGPGRKHQRAIKLEPWQQEIVARYPGDFARGLFHSDGCRTGNRVRRPAKSGDRWYEYPRYYSKPTTISVARREAVARLDEFVGPKY
jgi:hypothetical protein